MEVNNISDNWVIRNLENAIGTWNEKLAELWLLATKGHPQRRAKSIHQVIISPVEEHSKKPEEARRRIEALLGEVPHTGEIHFMKDGCACTSTPRFGYVPQQLAVDANSPVSVSDLVLASLSRRPVWLPRRKKDLALVEQVLSVTQVAALANSRVCDLSGGEIQRVLLALAIHPVPDILLLDEPVSGVDRAGLSLFYQLVSDLRHTHDITILLISHDLDLVARHADKVVLLDKTIREDGSPAQVYSTPAFKEIFGEQGGLCS